MQATPSAAASLVSSIMSATSSVNDAGIGRPWPSAIAFVSG
jgi:hypothetical protein